MNIDHIKISDFTYDLPEEYIAQSPLEKRDDSNLPIVRSISIVYNVEQSI